METIYMYRCNSKMKSHETTFGQTNKKSSNNVTIRLRWLCAVCGCDIRLLVQRCWLNCHRSENSPNIDWIGKSRDCKAMAMKWADTPQIASKQRSAAKVHEIAHESSEMGETTTKWFFGGTFDIELRRWIKGTQKNELKLQKRQIR